jgi:1-acyl-sn-glycerol-3-phosphate acyltransferase
MIPVVVDRPYRFIPPYPGRFWLRCVQPIIPWYLNRSWGIESIEFRGKERLAASVRRGDGILITPNHARPCDPFVIGLLPLRMGRPCHFIAAWHIFTNGNWLSSWLLRRVGAFSLNRWSMDRESLKASIQILSDAQRILMLFPEGIITRSNDRLRTLLDGTAFLARSAAKNRAKRSPPGRVVIHPTHIRYVFRGNLPATARPILETIEKRIGWRPQDETEIPERVVRIAHGLLSLRETEFLGEARKGPLAERNRALIETILRPMESEWARGDHSGPVVERVKRIRTAILPEILGNSLGAAEREHRWRCIADCYLAQQLDCYPDDYLADPVSVERILETIERFEEDLTDVATIHRPLKAIVEYGEAIQVDPAANRKGDEEVMRRLEAALRQMLESTQHESTPFARKNGHP